MTIILIAETSFKYKLKNSDILPQHFNIFAALPPSRFVNFSIQITIYVDLLMTFIVWDYALFMTLIRSGLSFVHDFDPFLVIICS